MRPRLILACSALAVACGRYELGGLGIDEGVSGSGGSTGATSTLEGGAQAAGGRARTTGGSAVSGGALGLGGHAAASGVASGLGGHSWGGSSPGAGGAQAGSAGNDGAGSPSAGESGSGGGVAEGGAAGGPVVGGAAGDGGHGADTAGVGGVGGAPPLPRSCEPRDPRCGTAQDSCCTVFAVPSGDFAFGGVSESTPVDSHVSGFFLDRYEVTVSRFNAFLDDYEAFRARGELSAGAGAHPRIPGSGWNPAWEASGPVSPPQSDPLSLLEPDRESLKAAVDYCMGIPGPPMMAVQPVKCVSWYEAQAFCIWDGGRLPTELEWTYAAAGGDENRTYPWGNVEPTHGHAIYECPNFMPDAPCLIPPAGSYAQGEGRWGHLDLAGSLWEWTFDVYSSELTLPCNDCARVIDHPEDNPRAIRGGGWGSPPVELAVKTRSSLPAALRLNYQGFRCAYDTR